MAESGRQLFTRLRAHPAERDLWFLVPMGAIQVLSATLRLTVTILAAISTPITARSLYQKFAVKSAGFLLYFLTGLALILTGHLAHSLVSLKRRTTGCLVLCSLAWVFALTELNQQLKKISEIGWHVQGNATWWRLQVSEAQVKLLEQHRLLVASLLTLQCTILAFSAYLCIRIMWIPGDEAGRGTSGIAEAAVNDKSAVIEETSHM